MQDAIASPTSRLEQILQDQKKERCFHAISRSDA
jgi:hypothetical protein